MMVMTTGAMLVAAFVFIAVFTAAFIIKVFVLHSFVVFSFKVRGSIWIDVFIHFFRFFYHCFQKLGVPVYRNYEEIRHISRDEYGFPFFEAVAFRNLFPVAVRGRHLDVNFTFYADVDYESSEFLCIDMKRI